MADRLAVRQDAAAFDQAAAAYDTEFAGTTIGVRLREAVWSRVAPFVKPGMHALDLGCGTGEDALWLARTGCRVTAADGSPEMLDHLAAKASRFNLAHRVKPIVLDLNAPLESAPPGHPFDLAISNFGALNCIENLGMLSERLETWVKPGGVVALIFMGRFCAWESAYYTARLDRRAMRRWGGRARAIVGGQTLEIRYWSNREVLRAFAPAFRVIGVHGIGTFLPPSYLFHWFEPRARLLGALARLEQAAGQIWPISRMGDHTLIMLRRAAASSGKSQP
jgi:ubiquinone/menaquinone biosynthesis C-methylase UbiE